MHGAAWGSSFVPEFDNARNLAKLQKPQADKLLNTGAQHQSWCGVEMRFATTQGVK
jgi:hypothetical protein